jgi:hypothetical protein
VTDVYEAHAERLSDLLLEQLERLGATEHEEAFVLALVAQHLVRRAGELGEVIEFEARELDDRAALQMATALQAQSASIQKILAQVAADPRFGLLPVKATSAAPPAPPHGNGRRPNS